MPSSMGSATPTVSLELTDAEWIEMFGSPPAFLAQGDPQDLTRFIAVARTQIQPATLGSFTRDAAGNRPDHSLFFPGAPQDLCLAGETAHKDVLGKSDLMTRILRVEENARPLTVIPADISLQPRAWAPRRQSTYHPYDRQPVDLEYADYSAMLARRSSCKRPLEESNRNEGRKIKPFRKSKT
ncbi:hypothetical protein SERLA73DRAFT_163356 [Serpula lacrymans var. lacrymans S7.3]|uniref:Uncharacterized protein n=2 Tax=Serpula lacrymans var. lacrymans TaxID=341189 RepID=F8QD28_SERL3|nr:uncharacterized protein SERLADRAFT_418589 [Serpula lacrymans var. lacrymans S7.9]EGN94043.1 hypothetical protein SERLA73DRAFT_163356 [Serpula lacrymans var. lacrymans S7.3]EGO19392.1 hypothetical protein SERLADRAFT_418589 [Serpula lacrymans var. lacrymans S7.9]